MKRSERHHLKENPVAVTVAQVSEWYRRQKRLLVVGAGVILALLVIVAGVFARRAFQAQRASGAFAEAMVVVDAPVVEPPAAAAEAAAADRTSPADAKPAFTQPPGTFPSVEARLEVALPKLLAVADAYPSTAQGIAARYQAAAALALLGRPGDAEAQYRRVIDAAGGGIYGRMARLGLADAHLTAGHYDQAIELLQAVTNEPDLPVDAILMRLGRAYELAGRPGDALTAYTRVIEEFPASVYAADAEREVESLKRQAPAAAGE